MEIHPGHEGENRDGDRRQHSERPDWSPEREGGVSGNIKRHQEPGLVRFYRPEWRQRRSQTVVNKRPENSLKTKIKRT